MGSSKAPKTPDYTSAAVAQGQSDKEVAQYLTQTNRVNQVDPYGKTTWSQSQDAVAVDNAKLRLQALMAETHPRDALIEQAQKDLQDAQQGGKWTQTTTLTPEQQGLLTQQQNLKSLQNTRTEDLLKNFNPSEGDISDNIYKSIAGRYDDRFAREEDATRASLANQGFQAGSEGFNNSMTDFNRSKNDAYGDAATQAKIAGLGQYNTQMGYLAQLLGGVQGPTTPQYQPYAQATPYQAPDLLGAMQGQYQGDLNQTNAQNASRGQTTQMVGTLAAAAAVAF